MTITRKEKPVKERNYRDDSTSDSSNDDGATKSKKRSSLLGWGSSGVLRSGSGSKKVQQIIREAKDILEDFSDTSYDIKMISVDRSHYSELTYSAVLLMLRDKKKKASSGYIFIVEDSNVSVQPVCIRNSGEKEILVNKPAARAFDAILASACLKEADRAGFEGLVIADAMVLHKSRLEFDSECVSGIMSVGAGACIALINEGSEGYTDVGFSIPTSVDRGDGIRLGVEFQHPAVEPITSAGGMPLRADATVVFSMVSKSSKSSSMDHNRQDSNKTLTTASIYPKMEMVGSDDGDNSRYKVFVKSLVITRVETPSMGVGAILLAAVSVGSLSNEHVVDMFRPGVNDDPSLRNLGSMNFLSKIPSDGESGGYGTNGTILDLSSESDDDVDRFIDKTTDEGFLVTYEASMCSEESWPLFHLLTATDQDASDAEVSASRHAIWQSAMDLTGGYIADFFDEDDDYFLSGQMTSADGFFVDEDGEIRSGSEIGLVEVVTKMAKSDPVSISEYNAGCFSSDMSDPKRMQLLTEVKKAVTSGSFEMTGICLSVTFDSSFLSAIAKGLKKLGVRMSTSSGGSGKRYSGRATRSGARSGLVGRDLRRSFSDGFGRSGGSRSSSRSRPSGRSRRR